MRAGLLKEAIIIERPTIDRSDFGSNELGWKEIIRTRAKVDYSSGNRVNENSEIIWSANVNFTIRIYHKVDEKDRIIWHNKKYRILSIEYKRQEQSQVIVTELINE